MQAFGQVFEMMGFDVEDLTPVDDPNTLVDLRVTDRGTDRHSMRMVIVMEAPSGRR